MLEAAHSRHVLADPSRHAPHLPRVRACPRLPAGLRQQLREHSFAVRGCLPAFLKAGIAHPDATIEEEIALIAAVPARQLVPELVLTAWNGPGTRIPATRPCRAASSPPPAAGLPPSGWEQFPQVGGPQVAWVSAQVQHRIRATRVELQ